VEASLPLISIPTEIPPGGLQDGAPKAFGANNWLLCSTKHFFAVALWEVVSHDIITKTRNALFMFLLKTLSRFLSLTTLPSTSDLCNG
jgi:hypothetical protein